MLISFILALLQFYLSYSLASSYVLTSSNPSEAYVSDETWYVPAARNILIKIFHLNKSWWPYPEESNIENYLNTEHPPLGKYIIALSMIIFGDKPLAWRLPSILEASLLVIALYFIGWRLSGMLGGVIAAFFSLVDPMTTNMGSVAMLDMHLTFFSALTLLLLVYDRPSLALLTTGMAISVKYSGVLLLPLHYFYYRTHGEGVGRAFLKTLIPPLIILITLNLPLILTGDRGFEWWVNEVLSSWSWFTTTKEGPPKSSPIGWLFNYNYFVLTYTPKEVAAKTLYPIYLLMFLLSIIVVLCYTKRYMFGEKALLPAIYFLSIIIGYLAIYIKGNRSLYTFYAVQLSPAAALLIPVAIRTLHKDTLQCSYNAMKDFIGVLVGTRIIKKIPPEVSFLENLWRPSDPRTTYMLFSIALLVIFLGSTGVEVISKVGFASEITSSMRITPYEHAGIGDIFHSILKDYSIHHQEYHLGVFLIIFLSIIILNKELYILAYRLKKEGMIPPILLIATYSLLPGYPLSQAVFVLGVSLLFTGNPFIGALLLGFSVISYQFIIGVTLLLLFLNKKLLVPYYAGVASLVYIYYSVKNYTLTDVLLAGVKPLPALSINLTNPIMIILVVSGIIFSLILAIYLIVKYEHMLKNNNKTVLLITLLVTSILATRITTPYTSPLYLAVLLPIIAMLSLPRWQILIAEYLVSTVVFLYTSISYSLSQILFKYTPNSLADFYHPANLIQLSLSIVLLIIIASATLSLRKMGDLDD